MQDLKALVEDNRFVRVTAADFNGKDFDGAPLVPVKKDGDIKWLTMRECNIEPVVARGGTDYAWFGVKDDCYNITWAGPGDYLYRLHNYPCKVVVIPGPFLKPLLQALGYEQ